MSYLAGLAGLFFAGMATGAINSVAGGGTLISFPSLVAFGEPEITSNATNARRCGLVRLAARSVIERTR